MRSDPDDELVRNLLKEEELARLIDTAKQMPQGNEASSSAVVSESAENQGKFRRIDDYLLLHELGRGGMGSVWLAEQDGPLRRKVAVKVVRHDLCLPESVTRFEAERQSMAIMDHPHIAKIFSAGSTDAGNPYFVMEFIDGTSLTEFCDTHQLMVDERLELFARVCDAVQHAHQKGVMHRDLKPSNILVTYDNGVLNPKVIDFGLSKVFQSQHQTADQSIITRHGQIVGTLEYMSPEQASSNNSTVDTRSDQYSLGIILHELLTGATPIGEKLKGVPVFDAIKLVVEQMPSKPSQKLSELNRDLVSEVAMARKTSPTALNKKLQLELDWITMKALEAEPSRRYENVSDLAADIRRFLDGDSIDARPPSATYVISKFVKKNFHAVAFVTSTLLLLTLGLIGTGWFAIESSLAEQKASQAEQKASRAEQEAKFNEKLANEQALKVEAALQKSEKVRARSDYFLAMNRFESSLTSQAIDLLEGIPEPERDLEWNVARKEFDGGYMTLYGHTANVPSVAFSPDGTKIVSGGYDKKVKLWDACSGALDCTLREHERLVMDVRFSADGGSLCFLDSMDTTNLIDSSTGEVQWNYAGSYSYGSKIAVSSNGELVASSHSNEIQLLDAKTGKQIRTIKISTSVEAMALSPDGSKIAASLGTWDNHVAIWDSETGTQIKSLEPTGLRLKTIKFSPDGLTLACSSDGDLTLWDAASLSKLWSGGGPSQVNCIGFSPDGRFIVSGCNDGTLRFWDAVSGEKRHVLRGHVGAVLDFDFHPDGTRIVSGSSDGAIKVWDARLKSNYLSLVDDAKAVSQVSFGVNQNSILSACRIPQGYSDTISVISMQNAFTGQRQKSFNGHNYALSPDGRFLAVSGWTDLTMWEIETNQKQWSIEQNHRQAHVASSFSPDGRWLASTTQDDKIKIRDVVTGEESIELAAHKSECTSLCHAPDGSFLASGGYGDDLKLWDINSGKLIHKFSVRSFIESIAISPDSKLIATGVRGGLIRLWNVESRQEMNSLRGHSGDVKSVAFNPAGSRLVSGSSDGTVRIWDPETGEQLRTLDGHSGEANSVSISAEGDFLAFGGRNDSIVLFDIRKVRQEQTIISSKSGWCDFAAFSGDGNEIYSSFRNTSGRANLGWSFTTKAQFMLPTRPDSTNQKNVSSDDHWLAVPSGSKVLLVDQTYQNDRVERLIRTRKSDPDVEWHRRVGYESEKRKLWFAAKFHFERVLRDEPEDQKAFLALGRAIEGMPTPKKQWPSDKAAPQQVMTAADKANRIKTSYFATPINIPSDVFQRDITSIEMVLNSQEDSKQKRSGQLILNTQQIVLNAFGDVTGMEDLKPHVHPVTLVPVKVSPKDNWQQPRKQNRSLYKLDFDEPFCQRQLFLNAPDDSSKDTKLLICKGKHQIEKAVVSPPIELMYHLHSEKKKTATIGDEKTLDTARFSCKLVRLAGKWVADIKVTMNLNGNSNILVDPNGVWISDFGDSGGQTLLGSSGINVDFVDQELPDPLGLGRRLYLLKQKKRNLTPLPKQPSVEYLMVVAAKSSGNHRLIVKKDQRITDVIPMFETGWQAHNRDVDRVKKKHRKTLNELRLLCGNRYNTGVGKDGSVLSFGLFTDLSQDVLDLICSFDEMTSFYFRGTDKALTEQGWSRLSQLKQLKSLEFAGPIGDDNLLKAVGGLRELNKLELHGTSGSITDAGVAHLANCTKLKRLTLSGSGISNISLQAFKQLEQLEHLTIYQSEITVPALINWRLNSPNCEIVIDGGGRKLFIPSDNPTPLLSIGRLKFDGTFSQEDYAALSKLDKISEIVLPDTTTLENLKVILDNKRLSTVIMTSNKKADNEYLKEIAKLPNLNKLNVDGCSGIDDGCVDILSSMQQLQKLSISSSEISQQALRKLKKEIPECRISYH